MNYLIRLAPFLALALLAVPSAASAQVSFSLSIGFGNTCGASALCQVGATIIFIINNVLVPVLFAIAFIVFLYGVFMAYIWSRGDPEQVSKGHTFILWGIIGFVVMISLWGLVNVVAQSFGLAGFGAPPTPTSLSPVSGGGLFQQGFGQQQPVQYIEQPQSTP